MCFGDVSVYGLSLCFFFVTFGVEWDFGILGSDTFVVVSGAYSDHILGILMLINYCCVVMVVWVLLQIFMFTSVHHLVYLERTGIQKHRPTQFFLRCRVQ